MALPLRPVTSGEPTLGPAFARDPLLLSKLREIQGLGDAWLRERRRPQVTLTYAQSLDGSIAARPGHPLAISGPESQAFTHGLRAAHDAILVGIGTVLADNPRLNVRLVPGANPQPVLLDSRLRFPHYANLLKDGQRPWIVTSLTSDEAREADLTSRGARVLRLPMGAGGGIDLPSLLAKLADLDIATLMVEGGAQVIASFLSAQLVDRLIVTVAPVLVGGLRVLDPPLPLPFGTFPRLTEVSFHQVGEDVVFWGRPTWGTSTEE